ncbi:uncharacterized protein LOC142829706 [Pelodiscus sinensis]|uniref:uncharacterized protein LOC142829706 n=1 Tax=Pelodiscus sinensis TaxID=13735 RepID=UPI003F6A7EEA
MERWDNQQWLQNFRMRKAPFMELCAWLTPALRQRDTQMQPTTHLEKRVAIAIWKLTTPDSYRSVGNQFSMEKFTVGALLMEVARAINSILLRRVIRLGDLDPIMAGFAALGFLNFGGARDGTHIPI